jgi:hypothetical protein
MPQRFAVVVLLAVAVGCTADAEALFSVPGGDRTPAAVQNCIRNLRSPRDGSETPWLAVYGDSLARGIFFDTAEALNSSKAAPAKSGKEVRGRYPAVPKYCCKEAHTRCLCFRSFDAVHCRCTLATRPTTHTTAPSSRSARPDTAPSVVVLSSIGWPARRRALPAPRSPRRVETTRVLPSS